MHIYIFREIERGGNYFPLRFRKNVAKDHCGLHKEVLVVQSLSEERNIARPCLSLGC